MRIVVTADLHVHPYRMHSADGGRDRLTDGLSVLTQTLVQARKHKAMWVFLGDLKVPKTFWPQEALTGCLDVLRKFPDVEKIMLPGNHDGDGPHGSGLEPFADQTTTIIREPTVLRGGLAAVPFGTPIDKRAELIAEAKAVGCRVLLTHGFLAGVFLGAADTRLPGKGMTLDEWGIGDIFSVAFFGDIHKGQRLVRQTNHAPCWISYSESSGTLKPRSIRKGKIAIENLEYGAGVPLAPVVRDPASWRGEVFYPGSPYQQSWGEVNDGMKGSLLVDLETGGVQLLPCFAPRFVLVEDPTGSDEELACIRGNFVRVVGECLPPEFAERRPRSLQFIKRQAPTVVQRAEVHAGLAVEDMLERYVEARPLEGFKPDLVLSAGRKMVK